MAKINVIVPKMGIVMLLIVTWVAMVAGSNGKIDGRIDLVIIAPAAHMHQFMDLFTTSIENLHKHIVMGDEKVRVAVVEPVHSGYYDDPGAGIVFNMSSSQAELEKWAKNWKYTNWNTPPGMRNVPFWHSEAFKLADNIFFNKTSDKTRAKMIIQVVNGLQHKNGRQEAYDLAKKLREKGVLFYATYDGNYELPYRVQYLKDVHVYVGNYPWRMQASTSTRHEMLFATALEVILRLTNDITRDLCTFCKYTKNQAECKPDKRPKGSQIDYFGDENARCGNVNPTAIPCPKEECEYECNRQWQWDSTRPCNDRNAKPCVDRHSRQPPNPPLGMENCLKEMKCNWTCPTTSTTSMPKTTITHPPTKKALPRQDITTSKSDDSMPLYLIILLAVVGVVIFFVIVAVSIIVIVSRRSSAAKRKAMEDLILAKKKRAEDREKHRHRGFGMDFKMGAQDNMGVSMVSTAESIKQGKLGAKSMASSSRMGGGKSMARPVKKGGKSKSPSMMKTRSKRPARKK